MSTVGVAELRQNLSTYLRRVERGERLVVTDHNRPVAVLGPAPPDGASLDRLIAEGRVARPRRRRLPAPLELAGDPRALSRALDEIRGEGQASLFYLDSSALVKLVRAEPESAALTALTAAAELVSCELALTELPRAIRRAVPGDPSSLLEQAGEVLDTVALLPLDRPLLLAAGSFTEPTLRALDAIHVAAAIDASPIDAFVSYDERQSAAARLAGLDTLAPGR